MSKAFAPIDRDRQYRRVYIVESRDWWAPLRAQFDPARDLVLTYDFALRREIEAAGGLAHYVDYLVEPQVMEANNHLTYEFFRRWFLDAKGEDIFRLHDVPFGFCFRIDIWNDLIFNTRARLCLQALVGLKYESLQAGTELGLVEKLLKSMNLAFEPIARPGAPAQPVYAFPIHRWMDEKVRSRKWRHRIKPALAAALGWLRAVTSGNRSRANRPRGVFIQEYHPTRQIMERLHNDPRVRVMLALYTQGHEAGKLLRERPIPVTGSAEQWRAKAGELMRQFRERRATRFVLEGGIDFTAGIFDVIERRIEAELPEALRTLDSVVRHLRREPIDLEIMISNLGRMNSLVDCVCRSRGVPSYMIINGMLAHAYMDEAKYATFINAYSPSIKANYFKGAANVFCLGDPRMDAYAAASPRVLDRKRPTVTIGTSGHNITNLGSYVAVEFEFMHDVLSGIERARQRGIDAQVIIKVRDNGYRLQYEQFVAEYFPALAPRIIDGTPMRQVLEGTDFYISIYSQTLFEASCLGIPAVYYKKDTEVLYPPFDGKSELVTARSPAELADLLQDFAQGGSRLDAFGRRDVLEKYIGPLDGGNLQRNLDFIDKLLHESGKRDAA